MCKPFKLFKRFKLYRRGKMISSGKQKQSRCRIVVLSETEGAGFVSDPSSFIYAFLLLKIAGTGLQSAFLFWLQVALL